MKSLFVVRTYWKKSPLSFNLNIMSCNSIKEELKAEPTAGPSRSNDTKRLLICYKKMIQSDTIKTKNSMICRIDLRWKKRMEQQLQSLNRTLWRK